MELAQQGKAQELAEEWEIAKAEWVLGVMVVVAVADTLDECFIPKKREANCSKIEKKRWRTN